MHGGSRRTGNDFLCRMCDRSRHRRGMVSRRQSRLSWRSKLDWKKINEALNTICPKCGHSIKPEERTHVDTEHIECPSCHSPDSCQGRARTERIAPQRL